MFNNSPAKFTLTEKEFAQAVGLSLPLVRQLRSQGRIPHIRVNSRVLYTQADVIAFLEAHRRIVAEVAA
jgi:excisionase family DNA binding protein